MTVVLHPKNQWCTDTLCTITTPPLQSNQNRTQVSSPCNYILRQHICIICNLSKLYGTTVWTVERVLRARSTVPKGSIKYSAASSIQYSATSTGLWAHKSAASTGLQIIKELRALFSTVLRALRTLSTVQTVLKYMLLNVLFLRFHDMIYYEIWRKVSKLL